MKRWLMLLLASFALLLPAAQTQVSARDTYVVNGYLIWLGSGPPVGNPNPPPGMGWSGWLWLGNCWGGYFYAF
jgi:hypothetical protein